MRDNSCSKPQHLIPWITPFYCLACHRVGLSDTALVWFKSYFSGLYQAVQVNQSTSWKEHLRFGLPQARSKHLHLTFEPVDASSQCGLHLFADDTQLFILFKFSELAVGSNQMKKCVTDIQSWMTRNFPKLNSEKTDMLLISSLIAKLSHLNSP